MQIVTIHGPLGVVDVPCEDIYDEEELWADMQLIGDTITLDHEKEMTYEEYFYASGQSAQDLIDAVLLQTRGYGE